MGFLLDLLNEKRDESGSFQEAINRFVRGEDSYPVKTSSGAYVSEESSLSITAVYSAVKLIAWTLASLPLPVYKRLTPRGKLRAPEHPLYDILHNEPNSEMTSFKWRELMSIHQNLWGAGISEIEFDRSGHPMALWPIPPWRVKPIKLRSGSFAYEVKLDDNTTKTLAAYQVLVFSALSTSSYAFMSPIGVHRETLGLAVAMNDFAAKTFGQGTNPAGIVTHPGKLSEKSAESLKENLRGYSGLGNSHRLMLLEEGMKFDRIGLPPQDAQYLESRKFSVSDIARIYNVPLHLLQDHEKSTSWGSGIEEMNLGFVTFTLRPYLVQWEQEIGRRLFADDKNYYAEFLIEGLLRGKLSERYDSYVKGRNWGWLSANDIREIENMNPLPGDQGEIYFVPLNMQNAKFAGEKPAEPDQQSQKESPKIDKKEGENV